MANWAGIKAGIVDIIKQNCTLVQSANVFDYEISSPPGYPTVSVVAMEGEGEFADTARDRRSYDFKIRVLQERIKVGESQAETTITALVDQIVGVFDSADQTTLENTVIFNAPAHVKWGYISAPDVNVRVCEIMVTGINVV